MTFHILRKCVNAKGWGNHCAPAKKTPGESLEEKELGRRPRRDSPSDEGLILRNEGKSSKKGTGRPILVMPPYKVKRKRGAARGREKSG